MKRNITDQDFCKTIKFLSPFLGALYLLWTISMFDLNMELEKLEIYLLFNIAYQEYSQVKIIILSKSRI